MKVQIDDLFDLASKQISGNRHQGTGSKQLKANSGQRMAYSGETKGPKRLLAII